MLAALFALGCRDDVLLGPDAVADVPPAAAPAAARGEPRFASVNGRSDAAGSASDPWDLAAALSGRSGGLRPGDTLWVRGGTYRGGFVSELRGAPGAPIVVRAWPGERVVIDGASASGSTFQVTGPWTVFWGLEFTSSNGSRITDGGRPNTVYNNASNTKYVNIVVHDGGVAFYSEPEHRYVEVYGSIFYNNGWQGSDRGHGHGVYVKSNTGPVLIRDNVLFNQFGYGIHAYSNAGSGRLVNIRLEGNVAFNNGTHGSSPGSTNILVGGDDYATGVVIASNYTYFTPGVRATNVRIGYGSTANGSAAIVNNDFVGGETVLDLGYWDAAKVEGNLLMGAATVVSLRGDAKSSAWRANDHRRDPGAAAWHYRGSRYRFDEWRRATRLAGGDRVTGASPGGMEIHVQRNRYEAGRAHVTVYNWARHGAATVDLSGVIPIGRQYEIRNVQRLFGAPVASGTYGGGSVTIPLTGMAPPAPTGLSSTHAPRTGSEFNVFLVTSR